MQTAITIVSLLCFTGEEIGYPFINIDTGQNDIGMSMRGSELFVEYSDYVPTLDNCINEENSVCYHLSGYFSIVLPSQEPDVGGTWNYDDANFIVMEITNIQYDENVRNIYIIRQQAEGQPTRLFHYSNECGLMAMSERSNPSGQVRRYYNTKCGLLAGAFGGANND